MEKSNEFANQQIPLAVLPGDKSKYNKPADQRTKQEIESKQREVEKLKDVAKTTNATGAPASLKSPTDSKLAV